jgi:hypothetical protein
LPLAGQGGHGDGEGQGRGERASTEDVLIPQQGPGGLPRFRRELLEASKQQAPERYRDAVKEYYKELIR